MERWIAVDVFGIAEGPGGAFLRDAAIAAGHELGIFDALDGALGGGARTIDELAAVLGLSVRPHRLRALVEVLAALGAITRVGGPPARFAAEGARPPRPTLPRAGWGAIAEVIRRDAPWQAEPGPDPAGDAAGALRRLHHHLARSGAAAAEELVAKLGVRAAVDFGCGAGAYAGAVLAAHPDARATLVDAADVLALAAAWLGPLARRARLVPGDALDVEVGDEHDAALLINVLHLHPPDVCARLCAAAARAVAPGGLVVIKDLRVDDDRAGPLAGLLFALNMAIYTPAGDVYTVGQLRDWLAAAGLVELRELRLAAAPDAIAVIGRRPSPSHRVPDGAALDAVDRELTAALARTAATAWDELGARGARRAAVDGAGGDDAGAPPALAWPAPLRGFLARAIAQERADGACERADQLRRHYAEVMPAARVAQLSSTDEPGATLFHTPLAWERMPRLSGALDRLMALVVDAGADPVAALGAPTAAALRAASPTLAALYARTHYGAAMPLLYGAPADLAYVAARGRAPGSDLHAAIDRYLTAPLVHELCHFGRARVAVGAPHLDECLAGWLGVHVYPSLAYPQPGEDDALYAAPWLAQVGQAVARAFGVPALVRAQAGDRAALPRAFVDAAHRLGWEDWRARRTLHFLSDTFDPAPWVALALACGAGQSVDGASLAALAATPLAALHLPPDPELDRAIVEDGLRAMCLISVQVDGSFRTRAQVPAAPISIDARGCAIVAGARGPLDPVPPRYWLPPSAGAALAAQGLLGYTLRLDDLAVIPDVAAAICAAATGAAAGALGLEAMPGTPAS